MQFSTVTLLLSLAASIVAAPLAASQEAASAAAGSKKNVYLSTCSTRGLIFDGMLLFAVSIHTKQLTFDVR